MPRRNKVAKIAPGSNPSSYSRVIFPFFFSLSLSFLSFYLSLVLSLFIFALLAIHRLVSSRILNTHRVFSHSKILSIVPAHFR